MRLNEKMMKEDFIKLTKGERAVMLLKSGEKFSKRSQNGMDIVLYQMDDFFAEISYQEQSSKIIEVGLIEQESILSNYPGLFDLQTLMEMPIEK